MSDPSRPAYEGAGHASPEPPAPPPPRSPAAAPPRPAGYHGPATFAGQRFEDPRKKSPILAGILSVIPGLGQIYVGYYVRGFVHALVMGGLMSIAIGMSSTSSDDMLPLIPLFMVFFWLYNIIDAGRRATLLNLALDGGEPVELPRDFVFPRHGSLGAGLLLVGGSFVLLLNTRFGFSLAWVEQWWPLAPMLLGAYLVLKALQERGDAGKSG